MKKPLTLSKPQPPAPQRRAPIANGMRGLLAYAAHLAAEGGVSSDEFTAQARLYIELLHQPNGRQALIEAVRC